MESREEQVRQAQVAKQRLEALREGKLPSNEQLESGANATKAEIEAIKTTEPLSETGKAILEDTERILGTGTQILREKNPDENLQEALYHSRKAGLSLKKGALEWR